MGTSPPAQSQTESLAAQVIGARPKRGTLEERQAALRGLETELLEECIVVSRDTLRFREISEEQDMPPQEWVDEVGLDAAMERFRCAKSGWMSRKNAPIAVQLAVQLGVGIIKSRATEKMGSKTINAVVVQFPAAPNKYQQLVLAEGESDE